MKVIFMREELLAALIPCSGVVPGRANSNGMDGILMECPGEEPGTCRLSVYDLDRGLRTSVDCKILAEGKYILNTQKLIQILRAFSEDEVMISVNDKMRVTISAGSGSFEISALAGEAFPMLPSLNGDRNYTMPQYEFRNMLNATVFAADVNNPHQPSYNGVYFNMSNGVIRLVACDGFRLAINEAKSPEGSPDASCIVPTKILLELMKIIKDSEDEITVSLARKHIMFKMEKFIFFARLIDTEYLSYERPLEKVHEFSCEVFIDRAQLLSAVERALLITENKLGGGYTTFVRMDFGDNVLNISSVSESGSIRENIPCAMNGESISIGFRCRKLFETLRAVPEDVVTLRIRLKSQKHGAVIEEARGSGFNFSAPDSNVPEGVNLPENTEKKKFFYLVSPVNMNG